MVPRPDRKLYVHSEHARQTRIVDLDDLTGGGDRCWSDYISGVAAELWAEGIHTEGADIFVDSDIPIGGGLSSSASLEIAVALAILGRSDLTMDAHRLAELCQRAESGAVGMKCGIMDQLTIASCKRGAAMLIDCRTLDTEFAAIPDSVRLLVVHSGVDHRLTDGDYNDRRGECEQALDILEHDNPELHSLCDLSVSQLSGKLDELGETLYRRCLHVVSENQRVAQAVAALRSEDLEQLGALLKESHESLRDDFDVGCDESNKLADILDGCPGVYGSRQIGAGFGGCVLALVDTNRLEDVVLRARLSWGGEIGEEPWMHVVEPAQPASPVENADFGAITTVVWRT